IHVSANVMKVLRHLDADERLSQIGIHPDVFTSRKWDTGEILFELPLGKIGQQNYGASYITVHRHDLHAAILEKVQPCKIEFEKRLVDVKLDEGVAHLTFGDGSVAEADVVIGADGVNSKLREVIVGPSKSRFTDAVAHRAIYPSTLLGDMKVRNCTKWWGPNSHILIYYIEQSRKEIYLVTSAKLGRPSAWSRLRRSKRSDALYACARTKRHPHGGDRRDRSDRRCLEMSDRQKSTIN